MAARLRAISSNDKRRPLWRTSNDQNYSNAAAAAQGEEASQNVKREEEEEENQ